ncbi:MAG: hypothetical protein FJ100_11765 [Deltaproteobacteria bacterium]|nr:hypothetical protein [Deltaproteobacteria bacterium]
MGEVRVQMELANAGDEYAAANGWLGAESVRRQVVDVVADTGAVMMMIPEDLVNALGLRFVRKVLVTYADERKATANVAGPLTVKVGDRSAIIEVIVGPPTGDPLLGQIPLEAMDLHVDCAKRQLVPRPISPYLPLLAMK